MKVNAFYVAINVFSFRRKKMSDFKEKCGDVLTGGATGAAAGGSIGAAIGALGGPITSGLGATIGGAIGCIAGLFSD